MYYFILFRHRNSPTGDASFGIRRLIWDAGCFTFHVLSQWEIAARLSSRSQIGELMAARQGGICHYCLPTGFTYVPYENEERFVQAHAFAHRCTRCTIRHFVVGDRPIYKEEKYHHKLLHRAQHVVCSDREKARRMLANINLTHSSLVDDPELDKQYSYQAYLAHAVRAELMTLGGDVRFVTYTPTGLSVTGPPAAPQAGAPASSTTADAVELSKPSGSSDPGEASRFIEPGAPLVPHTTADPGKPMQGVRVIVDWDKVDLRKDMGRKTEALAALESEAKLCIIDDALLEQHGVTAKARVSMPGVTEVDMRSIFVATNTHDNVLAGIGNRHYAEKYAEVEYGKVHIKNQIGNPWEIIRRCLYAVVEEVVPTIMNIIESEIRRIDASCMEIPPSEIVSELHGKTLFPLHKSIADIAPSSFTEQMVRDNFEATSGCEMPKAPVVKGFVKPNETLGKVKPRLIQHAGPKGSAMTALMNKTIEECFFRLPYFVLRSIKGTDNTGVCERIRAFHAEYSSGGFASTDFGSFDSSVTDKCTADPKKPGIRRIVEEALMNSVAQKFPDSADYKNSAKTRWKRKTLCSSTQSPC